MTRKFWPAAIGIAGAAVVVLSMLAVSGPATANVASATSDLSAAATTAKRAECGKQSIQKLEVKRVIVKGEQLARLHAEVTYSVNVRKNFAQVQRVKDGEIVQTQYAPQNAPAFDMEFVGVDFDKEEFRLTIGSVKDEPTVTKSAAAIWPTSITLGQPKFTKWWADRLGKIWPDQHVAVKDVELRVRDVTRNRWDTIFTSNQGDHWIFGLSTYPLNSYELHVIDPTSGEEIAKPYLLPPDPR